MQTKNQFPLNASTVRVVSRVHTASVGSEFKQKREKAKRQRRSRSVPLQARTVHSRFSLTTRVRQGTSSKSTPTRSVVSDFRFPCVPWSTTSMRVCKVALPASTHENESYGTHPASRHVDKTSRLTMSSVGTEMASFSSPSHPMRFSRPSRSSVKPINRTLRKCVPCISAISSIRVVGNVCLSDRRNASEARCVKRVRDSNEIISECGTAVLSAGSDGNTRSTARCLRAVSEVRGKLEAKSLKEGWSDVRWYEQGED